LGAYGGEDDDVVVEHEILDPGAGPARDGAEADYYYADAEEREGFCCEVCECHCEDDGWLVVVVVGWFKDTGSGVVDGEVSPPSRWLTKLSFFLKGDSRTRK
jgi:hypothetical protein